MESIELNLFNLSHDTALAAASKNYMMPASMSLMEESLDMLPIWYGERGSAVLVSSEEKQDFLQKMQLMFDIPCATLLTPSDLPAAKLAAIRPWGWDPALCNRLRNYGVSPDLLPNDEQMEKIRGFSHRKQAIDLLPRLQLNERFCGESAYLTSLDDCRSYVKGHEQCIFKAPISGSGRGLRWCTRSIDKNLAGWTERVIGQQGGIIIEPFCHKVLDFAMEFYSDGKGGVKFCNYSFFNNNEKGGYAYNIFLSDEQFLEKFSSFISVHYYLDLQDKLIEELTSIYGNWYEGYIGVDMMLCNPSADDHTTYLIHPCVEINLRLTMGVITHLLYERFVAPGSTGFFGLQHYNSPTSAIRENALAQKRFPLILTTSGKIRSGYLSLVPQVRGSNYNAYMQINNLS